MLAPSQEPEAVFEVPRLHETTCGRQVDRREPAPAAVAEVGEAAMDQAGMVEHRAARLQRHRDFGGEVHVLLQQAPCLRAVEAAVWEELPVAAWEDVHAAVLL